MSGERVPVLRQLLADGDTLDPSFRWPLLVDNGKGDAHLVSWTFEALDDPSEGVDAAVVCTGLDGVDAGRPRSDNDGIIRSLIEHSSDILGVFSPDGTVRYVSPSIQDVLGYAPADITEGNAPRA